MEEFKVKLKDYFKRFRSTLFKKVICPILFKFKDPLGFKQYEGILRASINACSDTIELDWTIYSILDNYIKWLKEHKANVTSNYVAYLNGISKVYITCYKYYNRFDIVFDIDEMCDFKWHNINRTWTLGRTSSYTDYKVHPYRYELQK